MPLPRSRARKSMACSRSGWATASHRRARRRSGGAAPTASRQGSPPSSRTVPPSARSRPSSTRMVVDLPAPLGPRKPVMSPGATVRSRPSSALVRPKDLDRPWISTASCDRRGVSPLQGPLLSRHRSSPSLDVLNGMPFSRVRQECVVHRRVGHQALGVDLEGGQHHRPRRSRAARRADRLGCRAFAGRAGSRRRR